MGEYFMEENNRNRKVKIREKDGSIVEKNLDDIKETGIVNMTIESDTLEEISEIYNILKEVIQSFYPRMVNLEQFEVMFMRSGAIDNDVHVWSKMARTFLLSQEYYGTDDEVKKTIFSIIMLYVLGVLSKEEKEREDVKTICNLFEKS